jgi:hypothetical protein
MSGYLNSDGSELIGGLLPNGQGQAMQLDPNGNLYIHLIRQYTQLAAYTFTAQTTTIDEADLNVAQFSELAININCTAFSGSGSVVVKVKRKDSFGNYCIIQNSPVITGVQSQTTSIGSGLNGVSGGSSQSIGGIIQIELNIPAGVTFTGTIDVGAK